ncbi:MAG: ribonuclease III [Trichlorobacter sp.]|nr:ribonuclease III [Trichlorobacter sp.]
MMLPDCPLGYNFNDKTLLAAALTHSSYINEKSAKEDYQRLEFLGDAILGFLLAELLYQRYPHLPEGDLSRLRASLVDQSRLSELAKAAGLASFIRLGKGEEQDSGRNKPSILADIFEAVTGAIYLDGGISAVTLAVQNIYLPLIEQLRPATLAALDSKSHLQELLAQRQLTPQYQLVDETGPSHNRIFTMNVTVEGETWGTGSGRSKKAAQQEAAQAALLKMNQKVQ